ncbi:MAG: mannitol dehydrogenase family protein [Rhizobiaceae bacterium]|nr:mannitol dehydrogenase family protein [Rhizobiaceae bacterium]
MSVRLSDATIAGIPAVVERPVYDRAGCRAGIVHLGIGAFHRAHQAVYLDDCLNGGEEGWDIVGVSLRSPDTRDALDPQNGLYTLSVVDGSGEKLRVVGSVQRVLVAPENPQAVFDELCDPLVRIVTLTVTEKAYLRNAAGALDTSHRDIVWDLENPRNPRSIYGFLAEAIERRVSAGAEQFTVLSCDNLPANGATLRRLMIEYAALRDRGLKQLVEHEIAFPSSMVDRIVPATTDEDRARISAALGVADAWPVTTEPFMQWVVEDRFPSGRPKWERYGVEMVEDVAPFEDMKLRLLNGSHSAIAYLGLLSGHATVSEAFSNPAIRAFVVRLWDEAKPSLPSGQGLRPDAYTSELVKRYDNPALKHRTAQIANDGSQKLPQRIVATALDRAANGGSFDALMLTPAAWIAACEARGVTSPPAHFTDPLDETLAAIVARKLDASDMVEAVFDAAGFASGAPERPALFAITARHLHSIRTRGIAATLKEVLR